MTRRFLSTLLLIALGGCASDSATADPCAAADELAARHLERAAGLGLSSAELEQHRAAARRAHATAVSPQCAERRAADDDPRFPELPTPPSIPDDLLPPTD